MRVLATLADSVHLEQNVAVATIHLIGRNGARRSITLRAGDDVAENAYERPGRHARGAPLPSSARRDRAEDGSVPVAQLAGTCTAQSSISTRSTSSVWRSATCSRTARPASTASGWSTGSAPSAHLFSADRAKFHRTHRDGQLLVLENSRAFPRAYVVPEAIARRSRAEESALAAGSRPFDASRQVRLEEGPSQTIPLVEPRPEPIADPDALPPAAEVIDVAVDRVRVRTPDGPGGYLVLTDTYHGGWRARVDGAETPVYLANFLFRAVRLPPGAHTVEFVFDPLSLHIGRAVSLAMLAFCMAVLTLPWLTTWASRRRGHRTAQTVPPFESGA